MALFDSTQKSLVVRLGDVVFDYKFRGGQAKVRKGGDVYAHAGIVVGSEGGDSRSEVEVAHVGVNDLRVERWNVKGAPKVNMVARLESQPEVGFNGEIVARTAAAKALEVSKVLVNGEQFAKWSGVDRGYRFDEQTQSLLATCVGFVQWCYWHASVELVNLETIPSSGLHLAECCLGHEDNVDWPRHLVRRYFNGFAMHALANRVEDLPYSVAPPVLDGCDSPDISFIRLADLESLEPLGCLWSGHTCNGLPL